MRADLADDRGSGDLGIELSVSLIFLAGDGTNGSPCHGQSILAIGRDSAV